MNWIDGMSKALDYIEDNLGGEISYSEAAKLCFCSEYHFQRAFSILCGYTLGEYIRQRRLTLAGIELRSEKAKVIDVALKYGYDSPDSFSKAFRAFHGILPSQARGGGTLKSFSRLRIKLILEGNTMNYKIVERPETVMTGIMRRLSGSPGDRHEQEKDFYVSTREQQYALQWLSRDYETSVLAIDNCDDDGFDCYIGAFLSDRTREDLIYDFGEDGIKKYKNLTVPAGTYVVCETERMKFPTEVFLDLRKDMVSELLPTLGYQLRKAPELEITHWYWSDDEKESEDVKNKRYIEVWLPVEKI